MSTKTKTKIKKLPERLPKLPFPPTGCAWEYMGTRWRGSADNYIYIHDTEHEWRHSEGETSGGTCHYCRAIKHPAPKPAAKGRKAVKAVRMWTQREDMDDVNLAPVCMSRTCAIKGDIAYAVLDISDEAALIEQVAAEIGHMRLSSASDWDSARAGLRAIGLIAKRRK